MHDGYQPDSNFTKKKASDSGWIFHRSSSIVWDKTVGVSDLLSIQMMSSSVEFTGDNVNFGLSTKVK